MKKFVALYLAPQSAMEQMSKATPGQMKAGMDAWMEWADKNRSAIVDLGAPLGATKRVTTAGVSQSRNEITGFSIVQAETPQAAAKLFDGHPHLHMPGASIDVLESLPLPGT